MAGMLALVTVAVYWPATGYDFVSYDDDVYVTSNAYVQDGLTLAGMKWACLNPVADTWHPLTLLSHMLVYQACGLNPRGHHLTSVVLHTFNAVLVFALLQAMTGARWRSLLVAALFALHPLRVESVAWVAERKDVLSGFFGLLALIAYARYVEGRRQPRMEHGLNTDESRQKEAGGMRKVGTRFHPSSSIFYLSSLLFFALGLMSKPMLVTWPFVMLLLDYWPLRRMRNVECGMRNAEGKRLEKEPRMEHGWNTDRGREKAGCEVRCEETGDAPPATRPVSSASRSMKESQIANRKAQMLLRLVLEKLPFFALAAVGSVVTFLVQRHGGAMLAGEGVSPGVRVGNALISYSRYLGKLFWPTDLAVFYPHPGHWPLGEVLLAGGALAGVSVLLWVRRRQCPWLLVGWLWFVGTLVPVIGLVQVGAQAMADRYTYLPSLGVLAGVVWGAYELTRGWRYQVAVLSLAGGMAAVLCVALTRQQLGYWRDAEALFRHAVAVTENNAVAHNGLGVALEKNGQVDKAIRQYQEALRLNADYPEAHYNLGNALLAEGQTDEAVHQYREAIGRKPDYADAHNNLGAALVSQGQLDEAIRHCREAVRLKPDSADAHHNLGLILGGKGQMEEGIRQYQEALRLRSGYAPAQDNLSHRWAEYAKALAARATAFDGQGQYAEAIQFYRAALQAQPDQTGILNNLAWLRATCPDGAYRDGREAVRLASRACELTGYSEPLLIGTLAAAQAEAGDFAAAVATAERAASLATALGLEAVAGRNRQLLDLYRAGKPFHESRQQ